MAQLFNPDNPGTDPTGRFLDKNVQAGIGGTVILAETLNQLGDENEALIKAASLTPSNKDNTQWLQAVRKLYGDADTALKEELISKIEALKASDIAFDDSISISASDVQEAITALYTLIKELKAKDVAIDNIEGITASNVQQLGEALAKRYNIPLFFIVYPEDDGTFDDRKRPSNYYYNLYGVTTVWKKRFANTGAFIRFEGGFADENRNGLLQNDAIRNITGSIWSISREFGYSGGGNGVFTKYTQDYSGQYAYPNPDWGDCRGIDFNASLQVPTGSENRSTNIKVELYELISINGINIWGE